MILLDKAVDYRSLEPVYDYDGSVKLLVKLMLPVHKGEIVRVALTPFGYVAVPLVSAADRFHLGVATQTLIEGTELLMKVGGPVEVSLAGDYTTGAYLSFDGVHFIEREKDPPYALKGDCLYILSAMGGDTYKAFLFPREVVL